MDLNQYKTSVDAENDGQWVDLDITTGAAVLVARIGSKRYSTMLQRRLKPYRRSIRNNSIDDSVSERIIGEVMAETILLDWKNLALNGKAVPYSAEQAKELLTDPQFKDFREVIFELANDAESFRQEEMADAEKNSPRSSPGKQSGAGKSKP